MMKNLLQMFALIFPSLWKNFTVSTKILFFIFAFTVVSLYTIIVSWAAIKATTLDAADSWWHRNYQLAHGENDKLRVEILGTLKELKDISVENRDDIKFLNRTLIEKRQGVHNNNP